MVQLKLTVLLVLECDAPGPGIPGPGNFDSFGGIGTRTGKVCYRKKISEPVSEKFGTKKVPVSVSEIFGMWGLTSSKSDL